MSRYFLPDGKSFFVNHEGNKKFRRVIKIMIDLGMELKIIRKSGYAFVTRENMHVALKPENLAILLSSQNLEKALREAAKQRRSQNLVFLLDHFNINVNSQDNNGRTALHLAYLSDDEEAVDILMQNGADPNIPDANGYKIEDLFFDKDKRIINLMRFLKISPPVITTKNLEKMLRKISAGNLYYDLKFLLSHFDFNVNAQDETHGKTALHRAAERQHDRCVEILINYAAKTNIPDFEDTTVDDIIYERMQKLIAHYFGEKNSVVTHENLEKLLRKLSENNCVKDLNFLLFHFEVDLDSQDWSYSEESMMALFFGQAAINSKDGRTALHLATYNGYWEIINILKGHGASDDVLDGSGKTVADVLAEKAITLMRTTLKMNDIVKPVDLTNENLEKALRRAANGHLIPEIIFLLKNFPKININAIANGKTAMHLALYKDSEQQIEVVRLLINYGAKTDIADGKGNTAEMLISKLGLKTPMSISDNKVSNEMVGCLTI